MLPYFCSMALKFLWFFAAVCEKSRSLDLASLPFFKSWACKNIFDWFAVLQRFLQIIRSQYLTDVTCTTAYSDRGCWMFQCYCHMLKAIDPPRYLAKISDENSDWKSGSSKWRSMAQDNCKLKYSIELKWGMIKPCILVLSLTQRWKCWGSVSASADLTKGVSLDAAVVSSRLVGRKSRISGLASFSGRHIIRMVVSSTSSITLLFKKWLQQTDHKVWNPVQLNLQCFFSEWTCNE